MGVRVVCLGAGQDVGRSCVLVTVGGKNIMFDCGMHMGYNDERRFPDFTYISKTGNLTSILDAVVITHFHLDHCGALPFFTEMCGYDGPIYMTYPTKAICPIMLEDYRKISVDRKGITNFFTSQMVKDCMKKVIAVNLHETIRVDDDLELKAYYAGHVLGAAMFYARAGGESVVYTGDYNMTPDRHLGSAWIDKCRPDVLMTESTYATTIRDSKRTRERDFLKKVHDCVADGGKVLIPVFALGRAQELCILIESYWERMGLTVPVYFSTGLTERANQYYKLFINWTNQKIKSTFVQRNMFEFKCISAWERDFIDLPGPMVLFATPGMLHVGTSLDVFKKWAPDPKNMIIMPGYCVAGTVGAKVLAGQKVIEIDQHTKIQVNIQVRNLSFSAHADAKGIMELIRQCEPRHVVLVHGEKSKMGFLCNKIVREFGIDCLFPANGESITLDASKDVPVDIEVGLLKSWLANAPKNSVFSTLPHRGAKDDVMNQDEDDLDWDAPDDCLGDDFDDDFPESEFGSASSSVLPPLVTQQIRPHTEFPVDGILIIDPPTQSTGYSDLRISATLPRARIVSSAGATRDFGLPVHRMQFDVSRPFSAAVMRQMAALDKGDLAKKAASIEASAELLCSYALERIYRRLVGVVGNDVKIERTTEEIKARSVIVSASEPAGEELRVRWDYKDEDFAIRVLDLVGRILAT